MNSEKEGRLDRLLSGIVFFANALIQLLSIGLAIGSGFTAYSISEHMNVIENYDKGELLRVICIMGVVGWVVAVYATFLMYNSTTPWKAYRLRYILYSYFGWGSSLIAIYFVAAALVYVGHDFQEVFTPGFNAVNYSTDATVRRAIDRIQIVFSCCGNQNHTEWFKILFRNSPRRVAIPESCCNPSNSCIRVAPVYEIRKLTPHNRGCLEAVTSSYTSIILHVAAIFALIAAIEAFVLVLMCVHVSRINEQPRGEKEKLISNLEPKKSSALPDKRVVTKKEDVLPNISKESPLKGRKSPQVKKTNASKSWNKMKDMSVKPMRRTSINILSPADRKGSKSLASGATSNATFGAISGPTSKGPSRGATPVSAFALTTPSTKGPLYSASVNTKSSIPASWLTITDTKGPRNFASEKALNKKYGTNPSTK